MQSHLGIVRGGVWRLLAPDAPDNAARRLTQSARQNARSAGAGELDMSEFEDCLVLVEGDDNGQWIYSAHLIDQCDALVTRLIQRYLEIKRENEFN